MVFTDSGEHRREKNRGVAATELVWINQKRRKINDDGQILEENKVPSRSERGVVGVRGVRTMRSRSCIGVLVSNFTCHLSEPSRIWSIAYSACADILRMY